MSNSIKPEVAKTQAEAKTAEVTEANSNKTSEETVSNINNNRNLIDKVINTIAVTVASLVKANDSRRVKDAVTRVLNTVYSINAADEYAVGVKAGGELYRFDEYYSTDGVCKLLSPRKVRASSAHSAIDFLDHKKFEPCDGPTDPATFRADTMMICASMRSRAEMKALSRPEDSLIEAVAEFAVAGRFVADRRQTRIDFLTIKVDEEARDSVEEWAKTVALTLFQ